MKKVIWISSLVFWLALIFYLSSEVGSMTSTYSTRVICEVKDKTGINMDSKVGEHSIMVYVRKNAHFFEYAVLGFLVYNVVRLFNLKYKILLSIILSSAYAISDELHQAFVPGRTAAVNDVIIDTLGVLLSISVIYIMKIVKNIRGNTNEG